MEKFYSLCLQGDIKSAMKYLSSIHPKTNEIIKTEKSFINRFFTTDYKEGSLTEDEWINKVILIYYNYFRCVLIDPKSNGNAEFTLKEELANLLQVSITLNIEIIEKKLKDAFVKKGFYFLGGVTPPYRGLDNLWVIPINEKVEKVYEKYGFETVEKIKTGHAFLEGKSIKEIHEG